MKEQAQRRIKKIHSLGRMGRDLNSYFRCCVYEVVNLFVGIREVYGEMFDKGFPPASQCCNLLTWPLCFHIGDCICLLIGKQEEFDSRLIEFVLFFEDNEQNQ